MKNAQTFKNVTYGFAGKWVFRATKPDGTVFELRRKLVGGRETADKVARQIAGAVARKGELDNLGRVTIDKIVAEALGVEQQ